MAVPAAIAKAAAMLLTNEKTRKGVGWILVAVFSPVILLIALLCAIGSGGAEHNNYSVEACFYGAEFSAEVPTEFRYHIEEMRSAFSLLDSAVSSANGQMDSGNSLDPIRVKAVFYTLCFGDDAPSTRAANSFVGCFYTTETRTRTVEVTLEDGTTSTEEEEYTVAVPVSLSQAYANLEAHLGREITEDDKSNIDHIYTMIAGSAEDGSYSSEYLRGDGSSIELDISAFTDPTTKNAADLVTYAIHAWESGWGYLTADELLPMAQKAVEAARAADSTESELQSLKTRIDTMTANLDRMYMDKLSGILNEDDFQRIYLKGKADRSKLEDQRKELERKKESPAKAEDEAKALVQRFIDSACASRELLVSLIERIELSEDKQLYIKFRFKQLNSAQFGAN